MGVEMEGGRLKSESASVRFLLVTAVEPDGLFFRHRFLVFSFVIGAFGAAFREKDVVKSVVGDFLVESCDGNPAGGGVVELAAVHDPQRGRVLTYERVFLDHVEVLEASDISFFEECFRPGLAAPGAVLADGFLLHGIQYFQLIFEVPPAPQKRSMYNRRISSFVFMFFIIYSTCSRYYRFYRLCQSGNGSVPHLARLEVRT